MFDKIFDIKSRIYEKFDRAISVFIDHGQNYTVIQFEVIMNRQWNKTTVQ